METAIVNNRSKYPEKTFVKLYFQIRIEFLKAALFQFAERRREITRKIAEIPDLHDTIDLAFMSREEKIENSARKVTNFFIYFFWKKTHLIQSYHLTKHLDKIADKANPAEMAHVTK